MKPAPFVLPDGKQVAWLHQDGSVVCAGQTLDDLRPEEARFAQLMGPHVMRQFERIAAS